MRAVLAVSVIVSALSLASSSASALTFGAVTNASRLGQPLDMSVAVAMSPDDTLSSNCVSADVSAGDYRLPPVEVNARLLGQTGRPGSASVHITTTSRVNEPVVTVSLSLGCPPTTSHKFVSLLDPVTTGAASSGGATATVASVPVARTASNKFTQTSSGGPAASALALADDGTGEAEKPTHDHLDLGEVTARIDRLQQDNDAAQQTLSSVQSRLHELEASRRGDPLGYALASAVVLLLIVIVVLVWRLASQSGERAWVQETRALIEPVGSRSEPVVKTSPVTPPLDEVTMTSMRVLYEPSQFGADGRAKLAPVETSPMVAAPVPSTRRSLAPEEVIDLEQQADFFIALGQEDAAIDLLMTHVRSSGGTSPMPYLKLMQIYRQRGDGDAYERIRERFNRRFNGRAPAWEADPDEGREFDGYPEAVKQVQMVWQSPARAAELLEGLLLRRDLSAEPFELPAYQDLLFLYAVAREEAEREANPDGVDLLLPIGEDSVVSSIERVSVTPLPGKVPSAKKAQAGVDIDIGVPAPTPMRR